MSALIGLAVLSGFIAFLVLALRALAEKARRPARPKITAGWRPPASDALPYTKRKCLLSAAERSFYEVLRRLTPDHTVFAKVRLADVVYVTKGSESWQSHFNRISRKHLDFVLCDYNLVPVLALELDDSSHDSEERADRDEFVDRALTAAALPIVHVRAQSGYRVDELRATLSPHLRGLGHSPGEVAEADARYAPPAGWRPVV